MLIVAYKDLYVNTSFGKTHLIETGNSNGKPCLSFMEAMELTKENIDSDIYERQSAALTM